MQENTITAQFYGGRLQRKVSEWADMEYGGVMPGYTKSVKPYQRETQQMLAGVKGRMVDLTAIWPSFVPFWQADNKSMYEAQNWADLKEITWKSRRKRAAKTTQRGRLRGDTAILLLTGRLYDSLTEWTADTWVNYDARHLDLGTTVEYSMELETGRPDMKARPHVMLDEDTLAWWADDYLYQWIVDPRNALGRFISPSAAGQRIGRRPKRRL